MSSVKKVVLAYSGGLDTSIIIPWIKENYGGAEIIAYCGDVGQGDDLEAVRQKALATGASDCVVEDLREEFVRDYAFKALAAGAVYEDNYLLGTALARPLLAYRQVQCALARGRRRAGPRRHRQGQRPGPLRGDLRRVRAAPEGDRALAGMEHPLARGRARLRQGAQRARGPEPARHVQPRRQPVAPLARGRQPRRSLGRPAQGDVQAHRRTRRTRPDEPAVVTIAFERGVPVSLDGKWLGPVELVEKLNALAGAHGVGRLDLVENRLVGIKSRGVYETPAGTVLYVAHRELERLVLDRDTLHFKQSVSVRYAELIYDGLWFSTLRQALAAFVEFTEQEVTGEVRVRLFKGRAEGVGRRSPRSLYRQDLATFGEGMAYDHQDAEGFIRLFGLPERVRALTRHGAGKAAAPKARGEGQGRAGGGEALNGAITAPRGFRAAAVAAGIKPEGLDLALLAADRRCAAAAVFTANRASRRSRDRVARAPRAAGQARAVRRQRRAAPTPPPASRGWPTRARWRRLTARELGVPAERGGGRLDRRDRRAAADGQGARRHRRGRGGARAGAGRRRRARDHDHRHPARRKSWSSFAVEGGEAARVGAMAKGAGMIAPNMATMLAFFTTDADVEASAAAERAARGGRREPQPDHRGRRHVDQRHGGGPGQRRRRAAHRRRRHLLRRVPRGAHEGRARGWPR